MRTHKFALAGAGLLLLAAPACAGHSIRAERQATRQLNLQQAEQAQATNQASAPRFADGPANSPPAAAPTTKIATAAIESAATASPDGEAPATLSTIAHPPSKIATATVRASGGQIVGAVQRVDVTPEGTPTKLTVALIGTDEKLVVLDAGSVKYDPSRNEILAQQSSDQIKSLSKAG